MIQRYSVWHDDISTYENDDGEWVKWEDVEQHIAHTGTDYNEDRASWTASVTMTQELAEDIGSPVDFVNRTMKELGDKMLVDIFRIEEDNS